MNHHSPLLLSLPEKSMTSLLSIAYQAASICYPDCFRLHRVDILPTKPIHWLWGG